MKKRFIDIHSHILPGLDDGSQSIEDSIDMAYLAYESGTVALCATPHCIRGTLSSDAVVSSANCLRSEIKTSGIQVSLCCGMEIMGYRGMEKQLKSGDLLTLNSSRYVLVEFKFNSSPEDIEAVLLPLVSCGYVPVIAHPERYRGIQLDIGAAESFVNDGCLLQINNESLLGRFGREAFAVADTLIMSSLAAVIASDSHSPSERNPSLDSTAIFVTGEYGEDIAEKLLYINPYKILTDSAI